MTEAEKALAAIVDYAKNERFPTVGRCLELAEEGLLRSRAAACSASAVPRCPDCSRPATVAGLCGYCAIFRGE